MINDLLEENGHAVKRKNCCLRIFQLSKEKILSKCIFLKFISFWGTSKYINKIKESTKMLPANCALQIFR